MTTHLFSLTTPLSLPSKTPMQLLERNLMEKLPLFQAPNKNKVEARNIRTTLRFYYATLHKKRERERERERE
jgi:hypothetical protein